MGHWDNDRGMEHPYIRFETDRKKRIDATLFGPAEKWKTIDLSSRPLIATKRFACTGDGLLEAIVWSKEMTKKWHDGTCPSCASTEGPPLKRLKANNMPECCDCVLSKAVGQ